MAQHTRLIIDLRHTDAPLSGVFDTRVSGYVVDASRHTPEDLPPGGTVAVTGNPIQHEAWRLRPDTVWRAAGLDDAIRLRDCHPGLSVLPAVTVGKASTMYHCGEPYPGEGFRFYVPNTATLRGFQVSDRDLPLVDWLHQAISSGFESVWLDAADAEARGRGYDLEALERAKRTFPGNLWFSGGPRTLAQIERLRGEGGTYATVLPAHLVETLGAGAILAALGEPEKDGQPAAAEPQVA